MIKSIIKTHCGNYLVEYCKYPYYDIIHEELFTKDDLLKFLEEFFSDGVGY